MTKLEDYSSISNYKFIKNIGEGNFGKVKLGIYIPTGEKYAIKILNKKIIKKKMKNTIFKENEIITKFNHINIVYVFQIIEDEENYYIIMEYCKKGELFDYIVSKQRLSEEESSIFFYQLINGLEYIHKKGVAHRDLKPENLLLTKDKTLKIIDFGLSHEFDGENLLKTKCGSPSYASPEILKGILYDGFKTDVWCCGIILYAMVCGYLPFDGENNKVLFKEILECDPEYPYFMSEDCKNLIKNILVVDPNKRYDIEDIKKSEFYLKGKKLCKINYEKIEDDLIKRQTFFGKEKWKVNKNKEKNNDKKENKGIIIKINDCNEKININANTNPNCSRNDYKINNDNNNNNLLTIQDNKSISNSLRHKIINSEANNKKNIYGIKRITDNINNKIKNILNDNNNNIHTVNNEQFQSHEIEECKKLETLFNKYAKNKNNIRNNKLGNTIFSPKNQIQDYSVFERPNIEVFNLKPNNISLNKYPKRVKPIQDNVFLLSTKNKTNQSNSPGRGYSINTNLFYNNINININNVNIHNNNNNDSFGVIDTDNNSYNTMRKSEKLNFNSIYNSNIKQFNYVNLKDNISVNNTNNNRKENRANTENKNYGTSIRDNVMLFADAPKNSNKINLSKLISNIHNKKRNILNHFKEKTINNTVENEERSINIDKNDKLNTLNNNINSINRNTAGDKYTNYVRKITFDDKSCNSVNKKDNYYDICQKRNKSNTEKKYRYPVNLKTVNRLKFGNVNSPNLINNNKTNRNFLPYL